MSRRNHPPSYLSHLKVESDLSLPLQQYTEFEKLWENMRRGRHSTHQGSSINTASNGSTEVHRIRPSHNLARQSVEEQQPILSEIYSSPPPEIPRAETVGSTQRTAKKEPVIQQTKPVIRTPGQNTSNQEKKEQQLPSVAKQPSTGLTSQAKELVPSSPPVKKNDNPSIIKLEPRPTVLPTSTEEKPFSKGKADIVSPSSSPPLLPKQILSQRSSNRSEVQDDDSLKNEASYKSSYTARFSKRLDNEIDELEREISEADQGKYKKLEEQNNELKNKMREMEQQMKSFMESTMKMLQQGQMPQVAGGQMGRVEPMGPLAPPIPPVQVSPIPYLQNFGKPFQQPVRDEHPELKGKEVIVIDLPEPPSPAEKPFKEDDFW